MIYNGNQELSDLISGIAAELGRPSYRKFVDNDGNILGREDNIEIPQAITDNVWHLSQNFSTKPDLARNEFKNDFDDLIINLETFNHNSDNDLNEIIDYIHRMQDVLKAQITLKPLKLEFLEIYSLLNSYSGFITEKLMNSYFLLEETINQDDLQYMIDSYQTDSII